MVSHCKKRSKSGRKTLRIPLKGGGVSKCITYKQAAAIRKSRGGKRKSSGGKRRRSKSCKRPAKNGHKKIRIKLKSGGYSKCMTAKQAAALRKAWRANKA